MTELWLIFAAIALLCVMYLVYSVSETHSLKKVLGLAVVVPLATFVLYSFWGASAEVGQAASLKRHMANIDAQVKRLGSRKNVIALMEQRVQETPQQSRGWYLLGKLYFGGGDFEHAVSNLQRAYQLEPNNMEIVLGLCEARFYQHHQQLDDMTKSLVQGILHEQPKNANAINLLALDAFNRKHYGDAVQYWEHLIPLYPADSEDGKALLGMIARAQKLQGAADKS